MGGGGGQGSASTIFVLFFVCLFRPSMMTVKSDVDSVQCTSYHIKKMATNSKQKFIQLNHRSDGCTLQYIVC